MVAQLGPEAGGHRRHLAIAIDKLADEGYVQSAEGRS